MGVGSIPATYDLDPKCPAGCFEDHDYKVHFHFWADQSEICSWWTGPIMNQEECCNKKDGNGFYFGWCSSCDSDIDLSESTCRERDCNDPKFRDNIDCDRLAWCGEPDNSLPTGWAEKWGYIRDECARTDCASSRCDSVPTLLSCCQRWFEDKSAAKRYESLCPMHYSEIECCTEETWGGWGNNTKTQCTLSGEVEATFDGIDGVWDWWCRDEDYKDSDDCEWVTGYGCTSVYQWSGYSGTCRVYIDPSDTTGTGTGGGTGKGGTEEPPTSESYDSDGSYTQDNESSGGKE